MIIDNPRLNDNVTEFFEFRLNDNVAVLFNSLHILKNVIKKKTKITHFLITNKSSWLYKNHNNNKCIQT